MANDIVTVDKGGIYRNKHTDELVVAFFIDRPRSVVHFSPAAGATGREDRVPLEEFLRDYDKVAAQGEAVPELAEGEPTEPAPREEVRTVTTTKEAARIADRKDGEPRTSARK